MPSRSGVRARRRLVGLLAGLLLGALLPPLPTAAAPPLAQTAAEAPPEGAVYAWGPFAQTKSLGCSVGPDVPRVIVDAGAVDVATHGGANYAALRDGTVLAWGSDSEGRFGRGPNAESTLCLPKAVPGLRDVLSVAVGDDAGYALVRDGSVLAWGANGEGQLGDGGTTGRRIPGRVLGLPPLTAVAAAGHSAYGLAGDGTVWAWGKNDFGQLGDDTRTTRREPVQVPGLSGVRQVVALDGNAAAVTAEGSVWVWGSGIAGILGNGHSSFHGTDKPRQVMRLAGVTQLAAGSGSLLALTGEGLAYGWGSNTFGQHGDGTTAERRVPTRVLDLENVVLVGAGDWNGYAMTQDGVVWGWGRAHGVGDGGVGGRLRPVRVQGLRNVQALVGETGRALALTAAPRRPAPPVGSRPSGDCPGAVPNLKFDMDCNGRLRVAVVGDSYISGEGETGGYEPGTDEYRDYLPGQGVLGPLSPRRKINICHRSKVSWAYQVAQRLGASDEDILFTACSGAVVADMLTRGKFPASAEGVSGARPQIEDLVAFDASAGGRVDLVLSSIGGNDAEFEKIVNECLAPNPGVGSLLVLPSDQALAVALARANFKCAASNATYVAQRHAVVLETERRVQRALVELRRRLPGAQVWTAGYPDPIDDPTGCRRTATMTALGRSYISTTLLPDLNAAVGRAAERADVGYLDFQNSLKDAAGICGGGVNGLVHGNDIPRSGRGPIGRESFHPNYRGHLQLHEDAMAQLFVRRSGRTPVDPDGPVDLGDRPCPSVCIEHPVYGPEDTVLTYGLTTVKVYGKAGLKIKFGLFSTPRVVGRTTLGADGSADVDLTVQAGTPPGTHVLRAFEEGTGRLLMEQPLTVAVPTSCFAGDPAGDRDADGLIGSCDPEPGQGPYSDTDGDAVVDGWDNCPTVANPDQARGTSADLGTACDPGAGVDVLPVIGPPVSGPPASAPPPVAEAREARFLPLDPVRLLDTRILRSPVGARGHLDLRVSGRGGVPDDATAVVLNVTALSSTRPSDVRVYPTPAGDAAPPLVSSLNVGPGRIVANQVTVPVGRDGQVRLYNHAGATHLLADVAGAYGPPATGAASFVPLEPVRVLDTRPASAVGARRRPLGAGEVLDLALGAHGVPPGATAVVLNVTSVGATGGSDVRVYPSPPGADAPPEVSNLNPAAGRTTPVLVTVKVGAGGSIRFRNAAHSTHLLADLAGYFAPGAPGGFAATAPARVLDTRPGSENTGARPGTLGAGDHVDLDLSSRAPVGAEAVVLNVTAVAPAGGSDVRVYPPDGDRFPTVSNLNTRPGLTTANAVVVKLRDGKVRLRNERAALHLVADVSGWHVVP